MTEQKSFPQNIQQDKRIKKNKKIIIACCSIFGAFVIIFISTFIILWIISISKDSKPKTNLPNISQNTAQIEPTKTQSQIYNISENISIKNIGQENSYMQTAYIAKFHDFAPYQDVLEETISPTNYEIIKDENSNEYLKYTFYNLLPNESRTFNLQYKIKLNKISYDLQNCQGKSINQFLSSEKSIESDNQEIINLSQNITRNAQNECQASKEIYDWIGNNINYPGYIPDAKGAFWALQNRQGDCTEFADLFVALNRADNIPARFIEGLVYQSDQETDSSQMKHDWTQVFLPGTGWVPVDPTFGRMTSNRNDYFAKLPDTHATLTIGQNLDILHGYYFYYYEYNGSTIETISEQWRMQKAD
ncbi:MAG: transglutaminase-like domain-containing protein [Patescibacteria group bacterium]|nr:transglutaminase-like domain-containing protein [Patescibacteria group bacterium]